MFFEHTLRLLFILCALLSGVCEFSQKTHDAARPTYMSKLPCSKVVCTLYAVWKVAQIN